MIITGAVVLVFLIYSIIQYNAIVQAKVRVDSAWSQIDVQLQRRMDLIGNLVETVKGYANHEKSTLEAVVNARAKAISSSGPSESRVAYARNYYNESAQIYNTKITSFPTNLYAKIQKAGPREFFVSDEAARAVPKVQF